MNKTTLCPSARPEIPGSQVFGVISGTVDEPCLAYLKQPLPVTEEVIGLSGAVKPTEVFRTAAPLCREKLSTFRWCQLWISNANCRKLA